MLPRRMLQLMRGEEFSAPVEGGRLGGRADGSGEPVLMVHGGPGLAAAYLDSLPEELGARSRTMIFQHRGCVRPAMQRLVGPA